jgi:hypothetical protein
MDNFSCIFNTYVCARENNVVEGPPLPLDDESHYQEGEGVDQ